MRISFRNGIVRQQSDITNQPNFLQTSSGGQKVSLIVSPDPTIVSFAHSTANYLFEERKTITNAWNGPFSPGVISYWLYWDIDLVTGIRTFGHTTTQPVDGAITPIAPQVDQHWFDITTNLMKVWNGQRWVTKIRCFAGKYSNGSVLIQYPPGTQVGINTANDSGYILFDDDDKPVKKFDQFNQGKFITTETPLASQFAQAANFKLEASIELVECIENVSKWYAVCYKSAGKIGLAMPIDIAHPAVGVAPEDLYATEVRGIITSGFIRDPNWNWTQDPETPIFVGPTGELTTTVPQAHSLQQIGYIVSPTTLFIEVRQIIIYDNA